MSLKILGGSARGYFLDVPKGDLIRPTQVLLKRRIFDYYQDFSGFCFVDLCAGTGSMGIEAWSRGAEAVYFSEPNKKVYDILKNNLKQVEQKYQVSKNVQALLMSSEKAVAGFLLDIRQKNLEEDTVMFIDPPYENHQVYLHLIEFLKQQKFRGVLWIESDLVKGPNKDLLMSGLKINKEYAHGDSFVLMAEIP
ncbi:MAG: RsmD family RNA methyltransferase [Bacteriovoracaceae bacterium]|nr:RsmD family RNA methyltransferase [Bacteriovoracaceae bacterium]